MRLELGRSIQRLDLHSASGDPFSQRVAGFPESGKACFNEERRRCREKEHESMAVSKTDFAGAISEGMMSALRKMTAAPASEPPAISEHARVRAVKDIHEGDESVPAGATGTVVHVIKGGVGYDVEFTSPKHVIISASRSELAPA